MTSTYVTEQSISFKFCTLWVNFELLDCSYREWHMWSFGDVLFGWLMVDCFDSILAHTLFGLAYHGYLIGVYLHDGFYFLLCLDQSCFPHYDLLDIILLINCNWNWFMYILFYCSFLPCYSLFITLFRCSWDIIAENFGFMLIFGDLVWIPFTFSIQVCHDYSKICLTLDLLYWN